MARLNAELALTEIERHDLAQVDVQLGKADYTQLNFEAARDHFSRACALDLSNLEAHLLLDRTRRVLTEPILGYDRVVSGSRGPSCPPPQPVRIELASHLKTGEAHLAAGEFDRARNEFAAVIELVQWFPRDAEGDALKAEAERGLETIRTKCEGLNRNPSPK